MRTRTWLQLNALVGTFLVGACGAETTSEPDSPDGGGSSSSGGSSGATSSSGGTSDAGVDGDACPYYVVEREFDKQVTGAELCAVLGDAQQYGPGRGGEGFTGGSNLPNDCSVCDDAQINVCTAAEDVTTEVYTLADNESDAGDAGRWCDPLAARTQITIKCQFQKQYGEYHAGCPIAGRRPEEFRIATSRPGSVIGAYLAASAELEAASVPAFERMARELAAHGAPADLVARAWRACDEEQRHTMVVTALARAHGSAPSAPPAVRGNVRPLVDIAIENAIEGVVREGFGVVQALCMARRAASATLRAQYEDIARDECSHADLAADVARFCASRLTAGDQARVREAMQGAIAELVRELDAEVHPELVTSLGLPARHEALALAEGLRDVLWREAA